MSREIDLLDGGWYASPPFADFAWMREHAPAYWDAKNEVWALTRYDDVLAVELLGRVAARGLRPVGVAFHVGSQQRDPQAWGPPIHAAAGPAHPVEVSSGSTRSSR